MEHNTYSNNQNVFPIESLLSAKQVLSPKLHDNIVYFISNLSGHYSLYSMAVTGSYPIQLIPGNIALQNPHLMGEPFHVLPKLKKILLMIDNNGDELYQPMFIPLEGGIPKPVFGKEFEGQQVNINHIDEETSTAFFLIDDRKSPGSELVRVNLETRTKESLGKGPYGPYLIGINDSLDKLLLLESYGNGDNVVYYREQGDTSSRVLQGTPLQDREEGKEYKPNGFSEAMFVEQDTAVIQNSILFDDKYGIVWYPLDNPSDIHSVPIKGLKHTGEGVLDYMIPLHSNKLLLVYNIDGCSYVYEAEYKESPERHIQILESLVGFNPPLTNGVELGIGFDIARLKQGMHEYVVSFTKATMPSKLFYLTKKRKEEPIAITQITEERILGIPQELLSEGEDASYTSFDGLRISARLYRPSPKLGYEGPRPLVLYIHGGPQSQERPDFTWFSMPLIQYLTLNGFSVFVPNVRGSSGYGFNYMKQVIKDWGGKDAKDHIEGLKHLEKDPLIDSTKRFVVGRSYGGYMTLWLMTNYPSYWKGGCDMFGPYDLIGFYKRLPPSWQVYFDRILGNPEKDKNFLIERSPKTYFDRLQAPLLIVQGKNDPRVTIEESTEVYNVLKEKGKDVELLVFEDEGHDVIKFKNRVKVYQEITSFFIKHLND